MFALFTAECGPAALTLTVSSLSVSVCPSLRCGMDTQTPRHFFHGAGMILTCTVFSKVNVCLYSSLSLRSQIRQVYERERGWTVCSYACVYDFVCMLCVGPYRRHYCLLFPFLFLYICIFLRLSFCHWLSERREADPPRHRPVTNLPLCSNKKPEMGKSSLSLFKCVE